MGTKTTASADSSTAMGIGTTASGDGSVAMGGSTKAESGFEAVVGQYNALGDSPSATSWVATDAVFRVGVGTNEDDRMDALTVYKNGNATVMGNFDVKGNLTVSGEQFSALVSRLKAEIKEELKAEHEQQLAKIKEELKAEHEQQLAEIKEEPPAPPVAIPEQPVAAPPKEEEPAAAPVAAANLPSPEEIKGILNADEDVIDEQTISELMVQVDTDSDGTIGFDEFLVMMRKDSFSPNHQKSISKKWW